MKQLALDIGLATGPTLERFFAGPNEAALQHLRLAAGAGSSETTRSPVPTYLWGEPGSGKTHLLQAVRQALREQGSSVGWLDPTVGEPPDFDERWAAVVMDDVHLYDTAQQATAFNWFVNAISPASGSQRWVLAAGDLPPPTCRCATTCAAVWAGAMCSSCNCWARPSAAPCCARRPTRAACSWATKSWTTCSTASRATWAA